MLNVKFDYKGYIITIQCDIEDKLNKICSKFASKINEPLESKIYIFNNQLLNLNKTFLEQFSELDTDQEIKIIVNDIAKDDTVVIKYNFNGVEEELNVKKDDNFLEIIQAAIKKPIEILFGGKRATENDFKKNFNQLANRLDKERNQMNLLVFERESSIRSINDDNNDNENKNNNKQEEKKESEKKEDLENNLLVKEEKNENNNTKKNKERKSTNKDDEPFHGDVVENFIHNLNEQDVNKYMEYLKDPNSYVVEAIKKFFLKFFSILLAQFIIIGGLIFLGCYFKFNDKLYEKNSNTLGSFIPSIILLSFLYLFKVTCFAKDRENKNKFILSIIILYILIISLLLILLSKFCSYINIICTLSLVCLDLIFYIIFYSLCYTPKGYISFLISNVLNAGGCALIYFYILKDKNITSVVVMGIISLCINFDICAYRFEAREEYNDKQYLFIVMAFDFGIFAPFVIILFFVLIFIIYIVFLVIIYSIFIISTSIKLLFNEDQ